MSSKPGIRNILMKEFPNLSIYNIEFAYYRKCDKDLEKTREYLKQASIMKNIKERISVISSKYNMERSTLRHFVYSKLHKNFTSLVDEDFEKIELECQNLNRSKKYPAKLHALCEELNLDYDATTAAIRRHLYESKGIKRDTSKITDEELKEIDHFVRTKYINEIREGSKRKVRDIRDTFKFDISPYKNFRDIHRVYVYIPKGNRVIHNIYSKAETKEEFFKQIYEKNEYYKNTKLLKMKVEEKKKEIAKKFNITIDEVNAYIYNINHLGLAKSVLLKDNSLFTAIESYIENRVKDKK